MKFTIFFYFILVFILINCSSSPNTFEELEVSTTNTKPNILLVIVDDVSKDVIPNYIEGNVKASMPNLQSLMSSGITFDNTWVYSVCSPTRASILTGKYGVNTGVIAVGNEISTNEISLQQFIKENTNNAYATALIGKWHLSNNANDPITMGADYFAGILSGGVSDYNNWSLIENGTSTTSTEYTTTKLTDLAINWTNKQKNPWFLWLAYNAPHTPFHLPPIDLHSQGNLPTDSASINANPLPYYIAALEALDTEIGRFLKSLSKEERDNTLIIFISDNGSPAKVAQAPYSRQTVKGSLYEGGINVPMVLSGKGVNRVGVREAALINATDLYTTIANVAGVKSTEIYNSISFKDLFTNENGVKRAFIYSEKEDAYTIRNITYKYIMYNNGIEEFYNLSTDPYEKSNLIGTTLSSEALIAKTNLITEAESIRK